MDQQEVGGQLCDHLAYSQPVVDWEIWLGPDRHLPTQVKITYKTEPAKPVTVVTFSNWNPAAQLSDATFTPTVPDGYERLKMMRHATVEDKTAAAADDGADPAGSPKPATPRK